MVTALLTATAAGTAWADGAKTTLGLIEKVLIQPEGLEVLAKVDTGAENSSIDTAEWATFDKGGESWIRFRLRLDGGLSEALERPLVRMARVRRAGAETRERPVVLLNLCVDATRRDIEVNLSERPQLTYRMLLGASFLSGAFLVDVSQSHTSRPDCGVTGK
jgi:hypothetical protein